MSGHHHHIDPQAGDQKIFWAIFVNLVLTIAQIIGGLLSGSLALIADAIHNFSDAISLIIAFFARKIARRPASEKMTFGYGRAEVVAALVNYTTLIVIGFYLVYEAVLRFFNPVAIDGWLVVVIAVVAAEDLHGFATALITGKIVGKALMKEFTTAKPDIFSPAYGFGFSVSEDGNRFGHGGGFTGISANLDIFRDSGWIAIVMSNYSSASQPVSSKMRRLIAASDR